MTNTDLYELAASPVFDFIDSTGDIDNGIGGGYVRGFFITHDQVWLFDVNNNGQFRCNVSNEIDAIAGTSAGSYSFYLSGNSWRNWIARFATEKDCMEMQQAFKPAIEFVNVPVRCRPGGQNLVICPLEDFVDPAVTNSSATDIVNTYSEYIWGPKTIAVEIDAETAALVHKKCYVDMYFAVKPLDRLRGKRMLDAAAANTGKRPHSGEIDRPATRKPDADKVVLDWWTTKTTPGEGADANLRCKQDAFPAFCTWADENGFARPKTSASFSSITTKLISKSMIPNLKKWQKKMGRTTTSSFAGRKL